MSKSARLSLLVAAVLIIIPLIAASFGSLKDIRYKIKPSDGNRWSHLLGSRRVVRGTEVPGAITFTFDDGPDHRTTPILLDELDRYHVKATFFINGHRFHPRTAGGMENQEVLREIVRRGHLLGNHTFSHKDITKMDLSIWRKEVRQVQAQVFDLTGRTMVLFRPPFGRITQDGVTRLGTMGYTVVMWNLDPLDWMAKTPRALLQRAKEVIEANPEGGVFLLHDTNRNTAAAFPLIMEWLIARNTRLAAAEEPTLRVVGLDAFIRR